MFFELRQYRIFPGKRDQWVKFMDERIMPGQLAHGVVIVGSFVGRRMMTSTSGFGASRTRSISRRSRPLTTGRTNGRMSCDHGCRRCLTSRAW